MKVIAQVKPFVASVSTELPTRFGRTDSDFGGFLPFEGSSGPLFLHPSKTI